MDKPRYMAVSTTYPAWPWEVWDLKLQQPVRLFRDEATVDRWLKARAHERT